LEGNNEQDEDIRTPKDNRDHVSNNRVHINIVPTDRPNAKDTCNRDSVIGSNNGIRSNLSHSKIEPTR
jgi:hypothetical protein